MSHTKLFNFITSLALTAPLAAYALTDLEMKRFSQMRENLQQAAQAIELCNEASPDLYLGYLINYGRATKPLTSNDVAKNNMNFTTTDDGRCQVEFDVLVNTSPQKTFIKGECTYGERFKDTLEEAADAVSAEELQRDPESARETIRVASMALAQFSTMNCRNYETGTR